jgi:hypothetical protein
MNQQNQGQNKDKDNNNRQGQGQMKNPEMDKRASHEYKEQKKEQAEQQPRNDQGRFVSKDNK